MQLVYIPGVWDLLHVGHVTILRRAAALGDRLVVGCPSDEVVHQDKGRNPVVPLEQRMYMLDSLQSVDVVLPYYKLEFITHLEMLHPNILAVGETWGHAVRHLAAEAWMKHRGGRIIKLPYTQGISTTQLRSVK